MWNIRSEGGKMKKIFFGFLILFGILFKIEAKEIYYSDYGDFSDYTLEAIKSSELVNVEIERRYRFYQNEKVGEHRSVLDNNSNFQFVDLSDRKDNVFSNWSVEKPSEEKNRIIENKTLYKIQRPKPINHISFMETLGASLKLNDIEIYYLGEKIDYELILDSSDQDFNIYPLGTLTLDLKDYYNLQQITIKVKSIDFNNASEILVLASVPSRYNPYDINYFSYNLTSSNHENVVIEASDWIRGNVEYEEEFLDESKPNSEPLTKVIEVPLYRYQDPLFYFYNIERRYVEGYFKDYSNLIKDELDYKDYYRYQIRDQFEVEEEILITNYDQTLSNFVSSTVDYEITTNLDINRNGVYKVEFKTPFINIKKDVVVSIKENDLNDIKDENNKLNSELNNLKHEYDQLNFEFEKLKSKYQELNNSNKSYYDKLNSTSYKYNSLLIDYQMLQQKYEVLNNQKLEKDNCEVKLEEALIRVDDSNKKLRLSEQANKYLESHLLSINNSGSLSIKNSDLFWLVLIFLILFILLVIFFKKLSNKNKF